MDKITFNMDATSLGSSSCITNYIRTTIGELSEPDKGAYKSTPISQIIYGVAVHGFLDTMYKTGGHFREAKDEAVRLFNLPKLRAPVKRLYYDDVNHLIQTCQRVWLEQVETEATFDIITVPQDCWWCDGKGHTVDKAIDGDTRCLKCVGSGKCEGPATELTFKILFYEDDYIKVFLCGTIDKVGKFKGGCYAIGDWKTTGAYDVNDYLTQYEMSRQLRIYTLACKKMYALHPDSILGKVGATKMGAFIDAIFVKSKAAENEHHRTDVFQYEEENLNRFESLLLTQCVRLSQIVKGVLLDGNKLPLEGILNGTCEQKFSRCRFWDICKSNEAVASILLQRNFNRVKYDPLNFNSAE